jgi:hypothetical protein
MGFYHYIGLLDLFMVGVGFPCPIVSKEGSGGEIKGD